MRISRRRFIGALGGTAAASLLSRPAVATRGEVNNTWDSGQVAHLIPTASHERFLLKVSLRDAALTSVSLRIDGRSLAGVKTDAAGRFWRFDAPGLRPATSYTLQLTSGRTALCDPWTLRTFPAPDTEPASLRIVAYTCAGGYEGVQTDDGKLSWFLAMATRRRLLQRALSFQPDALIANGDHIYWDQRTALNKGPKFAAIAQKMQRQFGGLDWSQPMLSESNETTFTRVCDAQIADLYGTDLRSTPAFFLGDDHDMFENDEADDLLMTIPPSAAMIDSARSTQHLYYPEFLPDTERPVFAEGSGIAGRPPGVSDGFGTLRYGRLLEVLLYDTKRYCSLGGVHGRMVPGRVEQWLVARTAAEQTKHLMHVPSTPFGWSAGKLGEWYPDMLVADGTLGIEREKPYWPSGWWGQHQRLIAALHGQKSRAGVIVQGDLHATGYGICTKSGALDLRDNPVHMILAGTLGTGDGSFPSVVRKTPSSPSSLLTLDERMPPVEKNGFTVIDVTPDALSFQQFVWRPPEALEAIDTLEPVSAFTIPRR